METLLISDNCAVLPYLYGGVEFVLIARFNSFEPLDHWLDVAANFTLKRCGPPVVHGGVDRVSASQYGLGVGTL